MDPVDTLILVVIFCIFVYFTMRSPIGALIGVVGGVICSVIVCFLALAIIDKLPDFKNWLLDGDPSAYLGLSLKILFVCLLIFVPLMYFIGSAGIIF